jgi:hypothetical protein
MKGQYFKGHLSACFQIQWVNLKRHESKNIIECIRSFQNKFLVPNQRERHISFSVHANQKKGGFKKEAHVVVIKHSRSPKCEASYLRPCYNLHYSIILLFTFPDYLYAFYASDCHVELKQLILKIEHLGTMNNKGQSVCHVSGVPVERRRVTPQSSGRKFHRRLERGLNGLKVVKALCNDLLKYYASVSTFRNNIQPSERQI